MEKLSDPRYLREAHFICSAHVEREWPQDQGREVAFAGRSNVGKSSAINAITGHTRLARTSKTPGRTQQIVFFEVDSERRIVDLPGYGYAKVPKHLQRHWKKLVQRYLECRASLRGLILPIDIRRGPGDLDYVLFKWCDLNQLPIHILFTKCDKLSHGAARTALIKFNQEIDFECVTTQLFSAHRKVGVEIAIHKVLALLRD
ncbi:MAG: YihA family ribosome biogenesis GTP-binding protein [Acidiferrobacteraceae bacterium]|nr:YihA family ribosome biogenesis GTP-binding protein [Acidiferrobacteraceae bacterium]|tara:strand:- start:3217 stop:3822 length:606 start_codon:yes stop_codon:yes gene_type:complete